LTPTDVSLIKRRTVVSLAPADISRRVRLNLIGWGAEQTRGLERVYKARGNAFSVGRHYEVGAEL